mgnify:CR=1 FL=1
MSHIRYTISRIGTFYYNRRVPKHAVSAYGLFIRVALTRERHEAKAYAERLSAVLEASWRSKHPVNSINIPAVIESFKPEALLLSHMASEYIVLRDIRTTPPRMAVSTLIDLVGDKNVADYCREDAKVLVCFLRSKGNRTGTIRRRLVSLSAIFNYAYAELDLNKRNPFSRMIIQGEGDDRSKRGIFSNDQLKQGYDTALSSGKQTWLLMPLLGETGCRLAEVVGLRVADVDHENDLIHIRPNSARRLKTKSSERTLPLVGYAKVAMQQALKGSDEEWLFPRYIKDGKCRASNASITLSTWLKRDFGGLTAHCLRHTMRDRLRAVECPMDMIDQIGGWKSVSGVGVGYGQGYGLEQILQMFDMFSL